MPNSAPLREKPRLVTCEFSASPRCKGTYPLTRRGIAGKHSRNEGKIICLPCSRALKSSGRKNPNARYALDDGLFADVETDIKAYLLGWIASDGSIQSNGTISIYIHQKDATVLGTLRDAVCPSLPIRLKKGTPLRGFAFSSKQIVADVCRWLRIAPGKKDSIVQFPELAHDALKWAFLRGYFDGDGSVSSPRSKGREGFPYPRCTIASTSTRLLESVERFAGIPCHRGRQHIEWAGNNALDFMARLYEGAPISLIRKRNLYEDWAAWVPALSGGHGGRELLFRWAKCLPHARAPSKAHASDSGYDLLLLEAGRRVGRVQFFRTGLKIQPSYGWYFDLVPRSSISKTGYMLANSVGVIDRTYVGEVLVPLVKVDETAPDLDLPARVVQIIPRPIVHAAFVEVPSLDESSRGDGGFGSTGAR